MAAGFREILEVARKKRPRRWRKRTRRLDLTELPSLCKGSAMTDPAYLQETYKETELKNNPELKSGYSTSA